MQLGDGRWQVAGQRGNARVGEVAGGHDDGVGGQRAGVGGDQPAAADRGDAPHRHPTSHRCAEGPGVLLEERHDLRARHEPFGIRSAVAVAGQSGLPVGGEQAEGVPPLGAPAVRDRAAVEHDVLEAARGEAVAQREPGLAGADDDGGDVLGHDRFLSTVREER